MLPLNRLRFTCEWQAPTIYEIDSDFSFESEDEDEPHWEELLRPKQGRDVLQQHQLLGYAQGIPFQPELSIDFHLENQQARLSLNAVRLLFQLDWSPGAPPQDPLAPKTGPDRIWDSAGKIYFLMSTDDLRTHRFERAWMEDQIS